MKVIFRNSTLVYAKKDRELVSIKVGNDTEGAVLHSFVKSNGDVQDNGTSYGNAASPFISIVGIVSDIEITDCTIPGYTLSICCFFDADKNFISSKTGGEYAAHTNATIALSEIPTNAAYLRYTAFGGTTYDEARTTSKVEFFKKIN